ncbi:unnamed protein product [Amaranthus hypochondriacus]
MYFAHQFSTVILLINLQRDVGILPFEIQLKRKTSKTYWLPNWNCRIGEKNWGKKIPNPNSSDNSLPPW